MTYSHYKYLYLYNSLDSIYLRELLEECNYVIDIWKNRILPIEVIV